MNHPRICAHRGITSKYEENSISAIMEAVDMGLDLVEFDTQITKDGVWILHHDLFIRNEETLIKNLKYDELIELADAEGKQIDLLDDLLDQINGIDLNIECKSLEYEAGALLAEELEKFDYNHRVNISSFNRPALKGLYATDPQLTLSYLGYYVPIFRWLPLHRKIPLYSINPYIKLVHKLKVRSAHKRGVEVHVWTANEDKEILKCLNLDVDVIITDKPDRVSKLRTKFLQETDQS